MPGYRRPSTGRRLRGRFVVLLLALATGGCATNPVTGQKDLVLVSEQQELALGRQSHAQILKQYRPSTDTALQQYVDAVGQRLVGASHRPDLRYTFTLLDSTEINAFALPGGYIYITRGLLAYLNSEAELAAVLGHEIGHVTARHGVRQASSAQATSFGAGLLSVFFPQLGATGLDQALGVLGTALLRGYGREHELEADRLGAEYIGASGYDSNAMLDVVRTLKNHETLDRKLAELEGREARAYHGVFSTHPDNDTRLREIVQYAKRLETGNGERNRDRFLDAIDGLVFGENPAEGVFVDNRFLHGELGIAFTVPDAWLRQNQPDRLILADPRQQAYLLVQLRPIDNNVTPAAFLEKLGVGKLVDARPLNVDGLSGITGLAQVTTDAGARPARLSVILAGPHAYVFTGFTRSADALAGFDPAFLGIAGSFHRMTEAERALAEPRRIRMADVRGPVSWAALARGSPLARLPEDQLRVLNAADPGSEGPAVGRVKLVQP